MKRSYRPVNMQVADDRWDSYVAELEFNDEFPCMSCGLIKPLESVRPDPHTRKRVCVDCILESLHESRDASGALYRRGYDSNDTIPCDQCRNVFDGSRLATSQQIRRPDGSALLTACVSCWRDMADDKQTTNETLIRKYEKLAARECAD